MDGASVASSAIAAALRWLWNDWGVMVQGAATGLVLVAALMLPVKHDTLPAAEQRRSIGRFQLSGSDTPLLVDTTTGQTWRLVGGEWVVLPPPAGL